MAFSAASSALSGLVVRWSTQALASGSDFTAGSKRLGKLLPEVFGRLSLALGQRDHVARVVVHPDQPRGYRAAAVGAFAKVPVTMTRA